MQIIPVIDLMGGLVVHAKRGLRESYRPIASPLCRGSTAHAVIDGLLRLHPFTTLYIADLDALTGSGNHRGLLERLQADYPGLGFWVDQGWSAPVGRAAPVVGSESLAGKAGLLAGLGGQFILSLDFMGGRLLGEESLLEDAALWPDTVIAMSLARVGSGEGPDFGRLREIKTRWPEKNLVAAGGVRHGEDLAGLEAAGAAGVLLASALHSGAIGPKVLREFG